MLELHFQIFGQLKVKEFLIHIYMVDLLVVINLIALDNKVNPNGTNSNSIYHSFRIFSFIA